MVLYWPDIFNWWLVYTMHNIVHYYEWTLVFIFKLTILFKFASCQGCIFHLLFSISTHTHIIFPLPCMTIFLNPFSVSVEIPSFPSFSSRPITLPLIRYGDASRRGCSIWVVAFDGVDASRVSVHPKKIAIREKRLQATAGFEPRTLAVMGWCSRPLDHHGPYIFGL